MTDAESGPEAKDSWDTAAQLIALELSRRPGENLRFAPEAARKLEVLNSEHLTDLARLAIGAARRAELGTVDERHVEQAAEILDFASEPAADLADAAYGMGGILAGAGLASAYSITFTDGVHGSVEVLTAIGFCSSGFALVATALTLTLSKRKDRTGRRRS